MRPSENFTLHRSDHSTADLASHEYDVICIGSGWAGRTLAARIVKAGYTAVIIEKELVGGDCPFWACVPSKVLLRSPEALNIAKDMPGAKESVSHDINVEAAFKRRDKITMNKDDTIALVPLVESTGVHLVRGTGKLIGEKQVEVTHQGRPIQLNARLAVALCTGSEPIYPPIKGLKEADPWTPRDATSASHVPDHLIILGAGAVGCEMATVYRHYGSKVTLIGRVLPSVDQEASQILQKSMERQGIDIKPVKVTEVTRNTSVEVHFADGKITGSELLLAAGRRADLTSLGLESVGIDTNSRYLQVDENLCVKPGLYAVGDINGRAPLTHMCKYHGAVAANAILASSSKEWSPSTATADRYALPNVVFTDPVIASVGLTRKTAESKGVKYRQVASSLAGPGYSVHTDLPSDSWAQWLLDDQDCLVGATFVGTDAAELLHASTVAIVGKVPLHRLMHAVPSFPSLSWVYYNLMDAAGV